MNNKITYTEIKETIEAIYKIYMDMDFVDLDVDLHLQFKKLFEFAGIETIKNRDGETTI